MEKILVNLEQALWGWPLLILLIGAGLWLLIRLRFLPLRKLPLGLQLTFRRRGGGGDGVSPFAALCTSLSATIGTGNIVGVAGALSLGGPGALLWMQLSALTGLSLKYAEGVLAVRYRRRDGAGRPYGGPFAYIRLGLGSWAAPLAVCFSLFGAAAGLCGVGTFVQIGSVSACLSELIQRATGGLTLIRLPWGGTAPLAGTAIGLVLALLALWVMLGGMGRVSRFSAILVPVMGGLYVICCLWILLRFRTALPAAAERILRTAFRPEGVAGGLLGTAMAGVSRGVFSNEAGLGTAPIAAAAAEGVSPREQGLISMTATVFDTLVICTLTGFVILVTGSESAGIAAAMSAFSKGLPLPELFSRGLVCAILTLFAFTTVTGWSCFGTACLDDLTGGLPGLRKLYLILYAATAALAPLCSARGVWAAANLCNGLMAIPNVIALLLLSGKLRDPGRRPRISGRQAAGSGLKAMRSGKKALRSGMHS